MTASSKEIGMIADRILSINVNRPVRVSVDGFCAAGKTTFADNLAEGLKKSSRTIIRVSVDNFQNPPEARWHLGKDSPEGFYRHAFDTESIREHLLEPLNGPDKYSYRTSTYDIRNMKHDLSPVFEAAPSSVLIVDGLFLFIPELQRYWDLSIFLDTPFEVCIERARHRNQERFDDAEAVEKRYRERYVPGFQMYLDQVNPRKLADFVVGSEERVAS